MTASATMNNRQRKAMWAKMNQDSAIHSSDIRPENKMGIKAYSRDDIRKRINTFGKQGTTKFLGTRCQHCGGTDATFRHYRSAGGGKVSEVRCIRCKRNAGM